MMDYITNWLRENQSTFCGEEPCNQPPHRIVEIKFFLCAYAMWNAETQTLRRWLSDDCGKMCNRVYEWCHCNCTSDCDRNPNCIPHTKLMLISTSYDGEDCYEIPFGPGTDYPFGNWSWFIPCTSYELSCPEIPAEYP